MDRKVFTKLASGALIGALALASASYAAKRPAKAAAPAAASQYFVYVGTYTGKTSTGDVSKGVYGFRYDTASGQFTSMGLMAEVLNPSWVTTDPKQNMLYTVTERGEGPGAVANNVESTITAYAIDRSSGALKMVNRVPTGGTTGAQVNVDHTDRMIFENNYGSGSVAAFKLNADGSLGERVGFDQHTGSSVDKRRQMGPHPHAVVVSPDNRFLFVPDLGLDKVFSYKIDAAKQTLTPNDPAFATVNPGLGPRHLAFAPNGKFAYAICEMGSSVVAFSYDDAKGVLTPIQTLSTLPDGFKGVDNSAEIVIDRSGRHLYASNRGHDSVTEFYVEPKTGKLDKLSVTAMGGKMPRSIALDPTGKFLLAAGQNSDDIHVFAVDAETGALTLTSQVLKAPSPVSILFIPAK